MKTKIKLLAAAVALAASANAGAGIFTSIPIDTAFQGKGLAEAVFSIWDPTIQQSYALDTGTTWQTFRDNLHNPAFTASYTINTSPGSMYHAAIGVSDSANLVWNVGVTNPMTTAFDNFSDWGILSTSDSNRKVNQGTLGQANSNFDGYTAALHGSQKFDGFDNNGDGIIDNLADGNRDPALHDEYIGTIDNGGYAGNMGIWGSNWGTGAPVNTTANYGTDLNFWYFKTEGMDQGNPSIEQAAGHWTFTNDGTTGTLSYVPVPAAVWLFGSGLLGLVAIARRKTPQLETELV